METSGSPARLRVELPLKRIAYLKEHVRMTKVMEHFNIRYREHGNMICCWHDEQHPSARLYSDQDTYWCWVCSPGHGVDVIEFVIIQLGLEADVDPQSKMPEGRRHALATLRSIVYLEEAFGISYATQPWEVQLDRALQPSPLIEDPSRYWRNQLSHVHRLLAQIDHPDKWTVYADGLYILTRKRNMPIDEQKPLWSSLFASLTGLN